MKIQSLSAEEALESLHTRADGLSTSEAERRLKEFGLNRVETIQGIPLTIRFLKGLTHFFAVILWIAASLAFLADWYSAGTGMAMLGYAIVGVIVINAMFSIWQEYRAEHAMAALQKLLPHDVKVLRDAKIKQVSADRLVPGDVILLDDGDDIPADCRLIEAFGVRVNNATMTGESVPQSKDTHPSRQEDLLHSHNVLLAGTALLAGQARALVFATGMHTEFGKIAQLTQYPREIPSPLQKEIRRLSQLVAILAVLLGVIFFFAGQALGLSFWSNLLFAIGIIVANVPEGLLPTVTLALAMGSQRMARQNALIRHLPSVETLGCATVICTDKTGTLTQNRMAVAKLFLSHRVHDIGKVSGTELTKEHRPFFEAAYLCHTLREVEQEGQRNVVGDPMEVALVQTARQSLTMCPNYPRVDSIPFDSDRRRLSTLHRSVQGLTLYTKGALEAVLPLCDRVSIHGEVHPLDTDSEDEFLRTQETLAEQGLRVLAIAYRSVPEEYDHDLLETKLILAGLVGLEDPPRREVPSAVAKCRDAGIKVIMVTGDHPQTARAIAKQIGLTGANPLMITGNDLRPMSPSQLQLALDEPEILFARVAADQKVRIVQALRAKQHVVAVTGDGVNDAPALRQADIGIAMGQTGTDVARAAADMVLLDDNFASIVAAVEEGRTVFANIRKFLTYILTSNVPELIPYLAFALFKIPLALTIIQILAVDLGTDMIPALGLGAEEPESHTMQRPPRSHQDRLIDWALLVRSYLFLGLLEAMAAMATFFFVLHDGGWVYGESFLASESLYLQATTACLSAIVIMQVVNVFLCRSEHESVFAFGLFSNRLIWVGIVAEIVLIVLIDYTLPGNFLFGTAPVAGSVWLFTLPFALGMLALEEVRKLLMRKQVL